MHLFTRLRIKSQRQKKPNGIQDFAGERFQQQAYTSYVRTLHTLITGMNFILFLMLFMMQLTHCFLGGRRLNMEKFGHE